MVLCYHSIATPSNPSCSTANVPLEELLQALGVVRSMAEVVPLRVLLERQRSGRDTSGLVALTFDDAYVALLPIIEHVLRPRGTPFTLFVTNDASATGAAFWWDRIDDLFPRCTPERWRRFEDAIGLDDSYRRGAAVEDGPLRPLRQWLLATHRGRWPESLEPTLAELEQEVGFRTPHRAMTFAELESLGTDPMVDIGVHTTTHAVLPLLSDEELDHEIASSHRQLRDRFPRALPVLAFPFGLFDARTAARARSLGMEHTLSLGNRTLMHERTDRVVPRLSMSRGFAPWKFRLHLAGMVERARVALRSPALVEYPLLPSPTS